MVSDKFLEYYEYQGAKNESIKEIVETWEKIKQKYVRCDTNLINKKKKLLSAGDNTKYLLDSKGVEMVAKNPDLAYEYMLPEESKSVQEVRDMLNHYTNQCET